MARKFIKGQLDDGTTFRLNPNKTIRQVAAQTRRLKDSWSEDAVTRNSYTSTAQRGDWGNDGGMGLVAGIRDNRVSETIIRGVVGGKANIDEARRKTTEYLGKNGITVRDITVKEYRDIVRKANGLGGNT